MNKSVVTHLKNKFPNAQVIASGQTVSVTSYDGEVLCLVVMTCHGYKCGQEYGAKYKLDLAPIPKDARAYKLYQDKEGKKKVAQSEEYDERILVAKRLAKKYGYVPSMADLHKAKFGEGKFHAQLAEKFDLKDYEEVETES